MNTDQLKSFIQVAENLNFARAAEILEMKKKYWTKLASLLVEVKK